jgi:hypothetical protein
MFVRSLVLSALVVVVPASPQAQVRVLGTSQDRVSGMSQERILGTFRGRVDKEVRITVRGGDISSTTLSGADLRSRYRVTSPLPQQEGTVRVALENGRGEVSVLEQPTAANGYTAVIRVYDRSSGADVYRFTTYWTSSIDVSTDRRGRGRGRRANVPTLHWSGDVDGTVELRWRGANVNQRVVNGNALRAASSSVSGDVTMAQQNQAGQVTVVVREGRGEVVVVQQPTAQNRYTTIVRITDPARSYGHYDIEALWR